MQLQESNLDYRQQQRKETKGVPRFETKREEAILEVKLQAMHCLINQGNKTSTMLQAVQIILRKLPRKKGLIHC